MADPVGILGLTGTVEQLLKLTRGLIDAYKALKENTPAAQGLLATYQELNSMLTSVSLQSFRGAKPSHLKTVEHELDMVKRILTNAHQEVEALRDKTRIDELKADAEKIRECIFKLSSDENINWRLNSVSHIAQECCCPLIWAEKNLTSVCIDLNAKDELGHPSTCESKLKEAVLRDGPYTHVGVIVIGQGGVGKTCALRALAYDADIGKRFPGGVYLLTLGMDATIGTIIQQLCIAVKASGGAKLASKLQTDDNLESVVAEVQDWFREGASLFIIDDVWVRNGIDAKVLQSLSALVHNVSGGSSRRGRILYSTRNPTLFGLGQTVSFRPRDYRGDRAFEILLNASQENPAVLKDPECQKHVRAILDICAGLPLALNVAGSAVRLMRERWRGDARDAWKKYSEMMMNDPDRFEDSSHDYAYSSLYAMLCSSINILDDVMGMEENRKYSMTFREMHRSLCVMKRQDWLPLSIVQHLWRTTDESTLERGVVRMQSVGCAELRYRDGVGGVRLHDLTQDFARREAKKYDELKEWHRKLLDKYRTSDGSIAHTLSLSLNQTEEQYVFENVYRVCQEAGLHEEICELLQSAGWVSSVLQNGTLWALEQAVKDMTGELPDSSISEGTGKERLWLDDDGKFGLRKIARAARLCVPYLNGSVSNTFFQLHSRLADVSDKSDVVRRFLGDLEMRAPRPWLKTIRSHFADADELLDEIDAGFSVRKLKFSSDGISGCGPNLWRVKAFKHHWGKGVDKMTWDVHGASRVSLTRELEGTSTATTQMREGREGMRAVQKRKVKTLKRLADIMGATGKCYTWCFSRNDKQRCLGGQGLCPTCSDICDDLVAAGYPDGTIVIARFSTNTTECTIRAHAKKVSSICFSTDGSRVVSGSWDKTVRVWDVTTGAAVCKAMKGHAGCINSVAMSRDGSRVVSGSDDNTVRVWDVATGAPAFETQRGHTEPVNGVAISADGSRVLSGSDDTSVRVWDVTTETEAWLSLVGHTGCVNSVAMSADGRRIVSGSDDMTVNVWDVAKGVPICEPLRGHAIWVDSVAMSADGTRVASGSSMDNMVRVWDVAAGAPLTQALRGHTEWVNSVAVSADGTRVTSGSDDSTVRVWDVSTGAQACEALKGHTDRVKSVAMSADGTRVVSGSYDGTVRVWDVATGTSVCAALTGHTHWVNSVAISADGKRVVSASFDNTVRIWDVATAAPVCEPLRGHTDWVDNVAMSSDETRVASGSEDKTVCVWDVATGAAACKALKGHTHWVTSVAMSVDGQRVVSRSRDNTVRLWDVATESCMLVTEDYKWYETVALYCRSITNNEEVSSPEEEGHHYYLDHNAVRLRRGNDKEEVLAQLEPENIWYTRLPADVNILKGVVAVGHQSGGVGIYRIIK